jgi:hypothetical protein
MKPSLQAGEPKKFNNIDLRSQSQITLSASSGDRSILPQTSALLGVLVNESE